MYNDFTMYCITQVFSKDDEFKGTFRDSSVEYLNSSLESLVEPLICWYQLTRSHLLASKGKNANVFPRPHRYVHCTIIPTAQGIL